MKLDLNGGENRVRVFLAVVVIAVATFGAWYATRPVSTETFLQTASQEKPVSTPANTAAQLGADSTDSREDSRAAVVVSLSPTSGKSNSYQLLLKQTETPLSGIQLKFTVPGAVSLTTKQTTTQQNGWQAAVSSTTTSRNATIGATGSSTTVELSFHTTSFVDQPVLVQAAVIPLATLTIQRSSTTAPLQLQLDETASTAFTADGRELPIRLELP
jgi:hypothetical protein